jgi:sensor histidine kinase regulating citrate/malate metabolism
MAKIHVNATRDFIESSLTPSKPVPAIAEMIWNGFDANANLVQVNLDMDKMGGIDTIRILDDGEGIEHGDIESLFGGIGESWKKKKGRLHGRALHGKGGKRPFR